MTAPGPQGPGSGNNNPVNSNNTSTGTWDNGGSVTNQGSSFSLGDITGGPGGAGTGGSASTTGPGNSNAGGTGGDGGSPGVSLGDIDNSTRNINGNNSGNETTTTHQAGDTFQSSTNVFGGGYGGGQTGGFGGGYSSGGSFGGGYSGGGSGGGSADSVPMGCGPVVESGPAYAPSYSPPQNDDDSLLIVAYDGPNAEAVADAAADLQRAMDGY